MGVHQLWKVLEPSARPVLLESLRGKTLAIDASIWIYHFLKAMRDSSGNAMRAGHIIGFFRRICKLLFYEIRPVFVFDGAAPAIKRITTDRRKHRAHKRREGAKATANRILTLQLQRIAKEQKENEKKAASAKAPEVEVVGSMPENVTYYSDPQENDASHSGDPHIGDPQRPFIPQDQYDLPDLEKIQAVRLNDQRLLTEEELDEYAKQFTTQARSTGLIDSETMDFTSFEFQNLPLESQYQLLNQARLKSRLRMGYTSSQLGKMFPSPQEFSKFQIERVSQRNFFTQKLMNLVGLDDDLATRRVNSEKGKAYTLQKQDGGYIMSLGTHGSATEGGKPKGESVKQYDLDVSESEDDEFEDVNLNPKMEPEVKSEQQEQQEPQNHKDSQSQPDLNKLFGWESQVQREQLYSSKRKLSQVETAPRDTEPEPEPEPEVKGVEEYLPSWFSKPATGDFKLPEFPQNMGIDSRSLGSLDLEDLLSGGSMFKRAKTNGGGQGKGGEGRSPSPQVEKDRGLEGSPSPLVSTPDKEVLENKPESPTASTPEPFNLPESVPVEPVAPVPSPHPQTAPSNKEVLENKPESPRASTPEPFNLQESAPVEPVAPVPSPPPQSAPPSPPTLEGPEKELAQQEAEYDEEQEQDIQNVMVQELEENERFVETLSKGQKAASYAAEIERLKNVYHQEKRDADNVTDDMVRECMELLQLFGIPYVSAPGEAEAQCAELFDLDLVDGVVTDDGDCFLFGDVRVYRNLFNQAKYVEAYESRVIAKELGLDRNKLIALAYLLGSDYTEGIVGVGPVTGVELLADFDGDLAKFRDWWNHAQRYPDQADTSTTFRKRFLKKFASKLFLPDIFPDQLVSEAYWRPNVDPDDTKFEWGRPDVKSIGKFMRLTGGWDAETVNQLLMPIVEEQKRRAMLQKQAGKQSTLDEFAQINKQFRSKRAALATERLKR